MIQQESFDLESVYDDQIRPLMEEIIAIVKQHKMPMLASFLYGRNVADGRDDLVTTYINPTGGRASKELAAAKQLVTNGFAAFAVRVEQPNSVREVQ